MSQEAVGWVMDKDTSTKRIEIWRRGTGLGLAVEVSGPLSARVEVALDLEGMTALQGYVEQALQVLRAEQEA